MLQQFIDNIIKQTQSNNTTVSGGEGEATCEKNEAKDYDGHVEFDIQSNYSHVFTEIHIDFVTTKETLKNFSQSSKIKGKLIINKEIHHYNSTEDLVTGDENIEELNNITPQELSNKIIKILKEEK